MPQKPTEQDHDDLLSLFKATYETQGLSEEATGDLLDFAEVLFRENRHLRSQIESDNEYRNELEIEKLGLQIDLYNIKGENV
jgi:hypothetical protein